MGDAFTDFVVCVVVVELERFRDVDVALRGVVELRRLCGVDVAFLEDGELDLELARFLESPVDLPRDTAALLVVEVTCGCVEVDDFFAEFMGCFFGVEMEYLAVDVNLPFRE